MILDHLVDPAFHASGEPHAVWRWMRENAPVHWHPPSELPGFWSLTRYDDIRQVYRDPLVFSSAHGVLLRPLRYGEDPGGGATFALTDPPRHRELRSVVADFFTERAVRDLHGFIEDSVEELLDAALARGEFDFVHDVAAPLSMNVIGHILGVPGEDHGDLLRWTDEVFEAGVSLVAHPELMRYLVDLMDRRAADPRDDLVSALVLAMDKGLLTDEEILLNCENMIGASENGRLALAGGVLALMEHPHQWQRLSRDRALLATAVEEILRWTSSATHSMRRATRSCTVGGERIEAGDWVVLWVPSGNRDERIFTEPDRFDVGRTPNRHLALGSGEHFCLGARLARSQMQLVLSHVLDSASAIRAAGAPVRAASIAVAGPARLPMRATLR
ncbi:MULTISPECIES: cytochrome P450 [unclassified Micromonospora]|uniref:cytochrome P450 n=1 Tax=unclassified Micromonospora TaxID=2617518 RepID=UPI00098D68B5|nr:MULTISPECIES: cytochrome P450 [unclassified Micromonospora]MDI5936646.1 cytochrome P450 [Micromonospora sp. DH15]OON32474.1 cytochrome [Micromonospora sp. Rc5]